MLQPGVVISLPEQKFPEARTLSHLGHCSPQLPEPRLTQWVLSTHVSEGVSE